MCNHDSKSIRVATLRMLRELSQEELGDLMRGLVDYVWEDDPTCLPRFRFPGAEMYFLLMLQDMQRYDAIAQLRDDCCLLRHDPEAYHIVCEARKQ